MRQVNVPRKVTAIIQVWISLILVFLVVFFAFSPLLTLDMSDDKLAADVKESLADLVDIGEIPEKVDVSTIKILQSASLIYKLGKAVATELDPESEAHINAVKDLERLVDSKDGKDSIVMIMALLSPIGGFDEVDMDNGVLSTIAGILKVLMDFAGLLFLIGYVIVWPIILIITAIKALVHAFQSIKDPTMAPKVAGMLLKPLTFTIIIRLVLVYFPGVTWGEGMTNIFFVCLGAVLFNVIVSRLRAYNKTHFALANIAQIISLVQGAALTLLTMNILKTGFIARFMDTLIDYLATETGTLALYNLTADETVSLSPLFLIDTVMFVGAAALVLVLVPAMIKNVASNLGLIKRKGGATPGSLVSPILMIVACALPIASTYMQSNIHYEITSNGLDVITKDTPFFDIAPGREALMTALICAIVYLIAAIVYLILRSVLCGSLSHEDANNVLCGLAPAYEGAPAKEEKKEQTPEEEKPVEETPTEDENPEKAPAEETTEEAPAEETTEEAPAEETTEEAPAEETTEEAPAEETTEEAPAEETTEEAPAEETTEEAPAEETTEEAPAEETTEEAPAEETTEEAPAEETTEEAPAEETTEEAPAEETTEEAPAEETTEEAPAEETTEEAPAEETTEEAPAEETTEEAPAEETTEEAPAEETTEEAPAEETTEEAPAEEATPEETPV